jgi:hypothetical protein
MTKKEIEFIENPEYCEIENSYLNQTITPISTVLAYACLSVPSKVTEKLPKEEPQKGQLRSQR